jgi:WD40 repeat protein
LDPEEGGPPVIAGPDQGLEAVAAIQGGRVVCGGLQRQLVVWDVASPAGEPTTVCQSGLVRAITLLPDGKVVWGGDTSLQVWDPATPDVRPVELGTHPRSYHVSALASLPDGRVISGEYESSRPPGQADLPWLKLLRLWDPATPNVAPVELALRDCAVRALALLSDGRVASGEDEGRVLVWDPAFPGAPPVELGRHPSAVHALALLPDGRVASGGDDGRVLVWDPAFPGAPPVELGRHPSAVHALALLPDGRLASGGNERLLVHTPDGGRDTVQVACPIRAITTATTPQGDTLLVIAHVGAGLSTWSIQ